MRISYKISLVLFVVCLWIVGPMPAQAQKFTDIYMGMAFPDDEDVRIRGEVSGPDVDVSVSEQFDSVFVAGARFGAWFSNTPGKDGWLGFGIDLAYYELDPENIDGEIKVVPIVATLMFRYPGTYFQPYLGVGPGLYIADADADLSDFGLTSNFDSVSVKLGWGARAGFAIPFNERVALFFEYRLDWFEQKHRDDWIFNDDTTIEYDALVQHGLVGVSIRY